MSRIDDLIAELCPDGVVYKTLEEICTSVSAGGDVPERFSKGQKEPSEEFPYPIYSNGSDEKALYGYTDSYTRDCEAVTVSARGTIGYHTVRVGKFTPIVRLIVLVPDLKIVSADFLNQALHITEIGHSGGSIPQLTVPAIKPLRIPVPPMEVQREIVRILDTFSALEAELEAELEGRRIQYAHYRDSLLTAGEDWEWSPMGEVGDFVRGRRFTKDDVVDSGIPSIHYGEIYTHYGVAATATVSRVRDALAPQLRYAQPGDVVIAGVGETVEDVGKAVAWLGVEPVAIHDDCFLYRHSQNPKFISYYLQAAPFHEQKAKHVARAKVKRLSIRGLSQITIPTPPLAEQERIVGILDKFDALVNDLSVGLPAELAARRQQYEHYRDRLLTFEEAPA